MDTLILYANTYEHFYKQNVSGIFHVACGCVVGQQVAFTVGRDIRKELYRLCCEDGGLSRKLILEIDLNQIKNLTGKRILLLKSMAQIDDKRDVNEVLLDYSKLSG